MPATCCRSNSANTGNTQVHIENCYSCGRHTGNASPPARASQAVPVPACLGPRATGREFRQNRNRQGSDAAPNLSTVRSGVLLADVAAVLRLCLDGGRNPMQRLFSQRLLDPRRRFPRWPLPAASTTDRTYAAQARLPIFPSGFASARTEPTAHPSPSRCAGRSASGARPHCRCADAAGIQRAR